MTTAYTSLLGFALPVTGELNGTWGDVVNDSVTQLIEDSVANAATASVASGDWTLTTTGTGLPNQARCAILIPTGSPGVSRNIIAPAKSKAYIVVNQSNAAVVLKGAATTGVTIAAGTQALCAWSGSDFVQVGIASPVPVTQGGTGLTTIAARSIFVANTLNTLTTVTPGALQSIRINTGNTAWEAFNAVGTTDTQTLTNKTFTGYTETVYALGTSGSIALNPANGTIQTCAAAGTVTFTDSISAGQSIVLMLTGGNTNTINWPTTTWVSTSGNVAPTLTASSVLVFWKVSTTLYGSFVGSYV